MVLNFTPLYSISIPTGTDTGIGSHTRSDSSSSSSSCTIVASGVRSIKDIMCGSDLALCISGSAVGSGFTSLLGFNSVIVVGSSSSLWWARSCAPLGAWLLVWRALWVLAGLDPPHSYQWCREILIVTTPSQRTIGKSLEGRLWADMLKSID